MADHHDDISVVSEETVRLQQQKMKGTVSPTFWKIFLGMLFVWLVLKVIMPGVGAG